MTATPDILDRAEVPFDAARADRLMEEAGIDVLLATSKHNTRYLLGGYGFIFFSAMDAIGHSRYLPIVIYAKGRPEHAAYVANRMERAEHANRPFWTPTFHPSAWGTLDAAADAVEHLKTIGQARERIGIEPAFLPSDARALLGERLDGAHFVDATGVLERLRAIKTPGELAKLLQASELITDSMLTTIAWAREGTTKAEIIERLRREETGRGLHFDYCLLTLGAGHNRAPSGQAWRPGEVVSIDSGGNFDGYIGDLARPGSDRCEGGDVIAAGEAARTAGPSAAFTDFVAHGMGLISHEVPFLLTGAMYEGVDAERPLEAGMVLSIETTMFHPRRGFIKLEDTVVVTAEGCEMFGDRGREWNRGGRQHPV